MLLVLRSLFLTHLCRALAAVNSCAGRSPAKLLLRTACGFGLLPQNEFGSPPKNCRPRLGSGPSLSGWPSRAGLTKGDIFYVQEPGRSHRVHRFRSGNAPARKPHSINFSVSLATKTCWKNDALTGMARPRTPVKNTYLKRRPIRALSFHWDN